LSDTFFDDMAVHSAVKTQIVYKYFKAWSTIMKKYATDRIGYVDLYSGPGVYQDGTESTPMLVLRHAISDQDLSERMIFIFNDKDSSTIDRLRANIKTLEGIDTLRYPPRILNCVVGPDIASELSRLRSVPCLVFADPWGYKGLSLNLIGKALRQWGTECLLFFNHNRVNMALSHPEAAIRQHMIDLFGKERFLRLESTVRELSSEKREMLVVSEFADALGDVGAEFALWFRFIAMSKGREPHYYLFFGTTNLKGYKIMKEIMSEASSYRADGYATPLEFSERNHYQLRLFDCGDRTEDLAKQLAHCYTGRIVSVEQVFAEHSPGTHFIMTHYKGALRILDSNGSIEVWLPGGRQRRKGSMPDDAIISFE